MNLTVAGSAQKIVMIEAGANQVDDEKMLEAIVAGHEEIKKMVSFISDIQAQIGKKKFEFESQEVDHEMFDAIEEFAAEKVNFSLFVMKFMKNLTRLILKRKL